MSATREEYRIRHVPSGAAAAWMPVLTDSYMASVIAVVLDAEYRYGMPVCLDRRTVPGGEP